MKIIYTTKKNSYAAYKAAYLHLDLKYDLEKDVELERMRLYYLGIDKEENEVYIINYYKNKHIFKNIIEGLARIYNQNVIIIDID